jgi:hypothetical protein
MSPLLRSWLLWSGDHSKSVSAFQQLLKIVNDRHPATVGTRLKSYSNMMLVDVNSPDTVETRFGLLGEAARIVTTTIMSRIQWGAANIFFHSPRREEPTPEVSWLSFADS